MTNTINNGGPAFPLAPVSHHENVVVLSESVATGMTLRDYFAARAMQGIIEKYGSNPPYFDKDGGDGGPDQEIARWAYEIADAMLRAREVK